MGTCCSVENDKNASAVLNERAINFECSAAAEFMGISSLNSFVELSISFKNIVGGSFIREVDPFCVVSLYNNNNSWKEIGRTEVIRNSKNPSFVQKIAASFYFEEIQRIRFDLYSAGSGFKSSDASSLDVADQIYLGRAETILATIFGVKDYSWVGFLDTNTETQIEVIGEELKHTNASITMNIRCAGLDNKDIFSMNDSFLRFQKSKEDGKFVPCFKTEVKMNNLNPVFAEIKCGALQFAYGDFQRPIKIEAFDYEPNGKHDFVGNLIIIINNNNDNKDKSK